MMPALIECSPSYCFWKKGSDLKEQEINLTFHPKYNIVIGDVYAMDENYMSEALQKEANQWMIRVTPRNTNVTRPASLMLQFEVGQTQFRKMIPLWIAEKNPFDVSTALLKDNRPNPINFNEFSKDLLNQPTRQQNIPFKIGESLPESSGDLQIPKQ